MNVYFFCQMCPINLNLSLRLSFYFAFLYFCFQSLSYLCKDFMLIYFVLLF